VAVACAALGALPGCARLLGLDDDYHVLPEQPPRDAGTTPPPADAMSPEPPDAGPLFTLPTGKLLYHRYTEYYTGDSEMFIVDLPSGERSQELGQLYGLCHLMNGIFSPDGKSVATTGAPRPEGGQCGGTDRARLEVYLLDLEHPGEKRQLTANDVPDEDPQYSFAGDFLLFKHDGHIVEWPLSQPTFTGCETLPDGAYCYQSSEADQSKPVITPDDKTICYYEDHQAEADIYCFDRALGHTGADVLEIRKPAVVHEDVLDARPAIDAHHLYYVRERSVTNRRSYIARNALNDLNGVGQDGRFCTDEASNYIDPFSIGDDLLFYSSNTAGEGGYDLFMANFLGESVISLDQLIDGFNSPKDDLGACFWRAPQ
jgi:Tol biopolymer transport system component